MTSATVLRYQAAYRRAQSLSRDTLERAAQRTLVAHLEQRLRLQGHTPEEIARFQRDALATEGEETDR